MDKPVVIPVDERQRIGWEIHRRVYRLGEPITPPKKTRQPKRPAVPWYSRGSFVRRMVLMGATADEIVRVTRNAPQAIRSRQHAYQIVAKLGLKGTYKSLERRRKDRHWMMMRHALASASDLAWRLGTELYEVAHDSKHDGRPLRPDVKWRIGKHLYFFEGQETSQDDPRWVERFAKYIALAESGERFRVLCSVTSGSIDELIKKVKRLTSAEIFVFCKADEFLETECILTAPIWQSVSGKRSLIQSARPRQK